MHIGRYVALAHHGETKLADVFRTVADHHGDEPDVEAECRLLATWSDGQVQALRPIVERYGEPPDEEPDQLAQVLFQGPRDGPLALIRDLQDTWLLANDVQMAYTLLEQAAQALRDTELDSTCKAGLKTTKRQLAWLTTRLKVAAPQALVVA